MSDEPETAGERDEDEPKPKPKPSMAPAALYDAKRGTLNVKRIWALISTIVVAVGAVVGVATQIKGWARAGLGIDALDARVTACEAANAQLRRAVPPAWRERDERTPIVDPNRRLDEAMPRLATELRDSRKERRLHEQAITRLTTIHEFGLDGRQAREAAREAASAVERIGEPDADAEGDTGAARRLRTGSGDDPLSDLDSL